MSVETLTVAEAAVILRVTEDWLARAAARGDVPSRKVGSHRRFTHGDLEEYLERVRQGTDNPWSLSPQQKAAANRKKAS